MMLDPSVATTVLTVESVSAWYASSNLLGQVLIFIILLSPIYATIIASIVGRPRMLKTAGFFLSFMIVIYAVLVASVFILSGILSLAVP